MRRYQCGWLVLAATALFALTVPTRQAHAQAVFNGTGGDPDLGIGRLIAPYAIVHAAANWIQFGGELELRDIPPNGPAAGRVQDGDVLVAVDGALVTTRDGSERLFRARAGHPLHLLVRRQGRDREVVIVPTSGESSGRAARPAMPAVSGAPSATGAVAQFHVPGWLGIGLACNCTLQAGPHGTESWTFAEAPEVFAVGPGGPAERGGVRKGDIVERIDGLQLTTPEGGRQWSTIAPGQQVRLGIRRDRAQINLVVLAAKR